MTYHGYYLQLLNFLTNLFDVFGFEKDASIGVSYKIFEYLGLRDLAYLGLFKAFREP